MTPGDDGKSDLEERITREVRDTGTWLRLFYMLVFMIAFYFVYIITCSAGIIQFFARLFSGAPLASLVDFNGKLAEYARELVAYITYASNDKPFPFKE